MNEMAQIIADHQPTYDKSDVGCTCEEFTKPRATVECHSEHVADELTKAGYIKPEVVGYLVLGRDNNLYGSVPVKNKRAAHRACDLLNQDEHSYVLVNGQYRVANIVEVGL